MRDQDQQSDAVCTELPLLETTGKRPKLTSPTGDESPSCLPSRFLLDELIHDILLRLPVKSLVRFRCVSKSWKTLISDPQFAKDHLRKSITDPNMTHHKLLYSIIEDECKIKSLSLPSLFQNPPNPPKPLTSIMRHKYQILGSCNGLLCLFDVHQGYVRLWNPSTRCRSKRFPIGNGVCVDSTVTYHGFGYDHVNDKYKLLVVVDDGDNAVTKIFTFGPNSWTTIQNFPHHPARWLGKFLGGTLNWIAQGGKIGAYPRRCVIVSLDLAKETFSEVLLPDSESDKMLLPVLDVLRDCLCVCFFDLKKNGWVVWLMKEFGVQESWTILIMVPRVEFKYKSWADSIDPFCISENGVVLLNTTMSRLVLYNSNDGTLVFPRIWRKFGRVVHIYHESLVSPLY